jgi:hypothetical protein
MMAQVPGTGMPPLACARRVRARGCLVLVLCWLALFVPASARDPDDGGAGVCSGGACAGCKSMANEVGQGGEWEDFLDSEGFRAPRAGAPASVLEVGSGEGLAGLWFLSRVNASTLTSVDAWRDAAAESCFDANRRQAVQKGGMASASWSKHKQDETAAVLSFLENGRAFDIM